MTRAAISSLIEEIYTMPELLAALDAFVQEHRRCGDLDGGVERGRVWMACDCRADIVHPVQSAEPELRRSHYSR